MLTEYYRSATEILTSMAVASLLNIGPSNPTCQRDTVMPTRYTPTSPEWTNLTEGFYTDAPPALDEAAQLAALESFANRLLGEVVETPQAAVDLLNERFWDLV
jgi:hypothetical protein